MHGIDISYAQDNPNFEAALRSQRVEFVIARVCYGSNPDDDDGPIFERSHDECKRLGIPFGAYIFYLFDHDPQAQAAHFLQAANGRYGQIRPTVDIEEGSGSTGSVQGNIEHLAAFNAAIELGLKCQPIIYTNADTWNTTMGGTDAFAGHSLWVASYGRQPGAPIMPNGFLNWALHQHTSSGMIDGIAGYVDLDVTRLPTLEGLLR